jgi:LPXTG-motif cell wall-anchored protein
MAKSTPDRVTDRSQRTKIFDWKVPVQAGTTSGEITGALFWRGSDGGPPAGAFVALGTLVLLGGAAVVLVRRRRRTTPREEAW